MTWTLGHSIGMLLVVGAAWALGDVWPVAAFGAVSLVILVALRAGTWTPDGRFGIANVVTSARAALVVGLAALPHIGPVASLLVIATLSLDGLDGFLARRTGTASPFGGEFDMETDALFVLVATLRLAEEGRLGAWILMPGLYRYLYMVALSVFPSAPEDEPRSRTARVAFAVMVISLAVSLWPVRRIYESFALFATALITASFGRSAWWSFFRRPTPLATATGSNLP